MVSGEVWSEVKERLVDGFRRDKIILFGSQARGTADGRSDVDLLVICRFEGRRRELTLDMDRDIRGQHAPFKTEVSEVPPKFQLENRKDVTT